MSERDDRDHDEAAELLPWFVTGRLDPDEQAMVAAHVAGCAACQAEVAFQKQLEVEVARLPLDVERGWAQMRSRLEANDDAPASAVRRSARGGWIGWGVAATFAVLAGPAAKRTAALAALRARDNVVLAEPIAPASLGGTSR